MREYLDQVLGFSDQTCAVIMYPTWDCAADFNLTQCEVIYHYKPCGDFEDICEVSWVNETDTTGYRSAYCHDFMLEINREKPYITIIESSCEIFDFVDTKCLF